MGQRRILLKLGNADNAVCDRREHLLDHNIRSDQLLVGAFHIKSPAVRIVDTDILLSLSVLQAYVREPSDRPSLRAVAVNNVGFILIDQLSDFHNTSEIGSCIDRMMHIRYMLHFRNYTGKFLRINRIRTHENMLKLITIILF